MGGVSRGILVAAMLLSTATGAQVNAVQSIDVRIPLAPSPVRIGDDVQLFYEMHLTNFASTPFTVTELDVSGDSSNAYLARFEGNGVTQVLGTIGDKGVSPGSVEVLYFNVPATPIPAQLTHRLKLRTVTASGEIRETQLQTDPLPLDRQPLPELSPPLRGGLWAALYDPSMERGHRRVVYAVDGHAHIPGRFAIDFFGVDEQGRTHQNDGKRLDDYFGFGAEVLAVADGTIVAVRNNVPQLQTLAELPERHTLGDATGNYIAIDLGNQRFAFYEHLQPELRVKVGQKVKRGQPLGKLGLTGSGSKPHLHFHVADANAPLAAEGRPYHFTRYRLVGSYRSIFDFGEKPWTATIAPLVLRQSLPAPNVVIEFE